MIDYTNFFGMILLSNEPDLLKMCVRQAYQSLEINITPDSWYVFTWPLNFGDQRSCLDFRYRFLDGNNSVLNVCDVSGQRQSNVSHSNSSQLKPVNCFYVQMREQYY